MNRPSIKWPASFCKSLTSSAGASQSDLAWNKAPCRFCGTGCGVEVGVGDGKVLAVRGDVASPVNRGLLCVKGYHLPGLLYGADRLQFPQKRGADGKLERIGWDEALDLVAAEFRESIAQHGPDSVAMYGSGQWTIPECSNKGPFVLHPDVPRPTGDEPIYEIRK